MSFFLNRLSYWADIASDATNEQSDTTVWNEHAEEMEDNNLSVDPTHATWELTFLHTRETTYFKRPL